MSELIDILRVVAWPITVIIVVLTADRTIARWK